MKKENLFGRLKAAVGLTRERFLKGGFSLFKGGPFDEERLKELEEILIGSDVGLAATEKLISRIRRGRDKDPLLLLKDEISFILGNSQGGLSLAPEGPTVIMVIGVNGVGKTTTIAKIAHRFKGEGQEVILICGDTFRSAAREQLQIWAEWLGVEVITQSAGADPAAVIFDGLSAAKARKKDIVIIDTAGRLHTKVNLTNELRKIKGVCAKQVMGAPHEILLVLDATVGQNGIVQAQSFAGEVGVTGIILAKLDGTAKGGVVIGIAEQLNIPVKFAGIGEGVDDLVPFSGREFVNALLNSS